MPVTIDYLANHPQHTQTVIDWVWEEWDRDAGMKYEETQSVYGSSVARDTIPLSLIALDGDKMVGMMVLLESDFLQRPEPGPWRGNLLVLRAYRKQGIGTQLIAAANNAARQLGYKKLYVWSAKASRYESRPEYTRVGEDALNGKPVYVYEVDLAHAA